MAGRTSNCNSSPSSRGMGSTKHASTDHRHSYLTGR